MPSREFTRYRRAACSLAQWNDSASQSNGTTLDVGGPHLRVVRHRLYCHVVWTTRDRERLIDTGLATFLCRFLCDVARQERAHILEIGMVATHVHLIVRVDPTTNISRLLQRLKGGSSAVAGKERHSTSGRSLKWTKGYSIETVSPRALEAVRHYLRQQPIHHAKEAIPGWDGDVSEYESEQVIRG